MGTQPDLLNKPIYFNETEKNPLIPFNKITIGYIEKTSLGDGHGPGG